MIFYDASCGLCRGSRTIAERLGHGHVPMLWVDVNDARELEHWPQVDRAQAQEHVFVLDLQGQFHKGYEAVVVLLAAINHLARLLRPVLLSSPMKRLGHPVYRWISRRRHALSGFIPKM